MQIIKVKIPLESSKDTREYREGLDEAGGSNAAELSGAAKKNSVNNVNLAANISGQATSAQGGAELPKNERI